VPGSLALPLLFRSGGEVNTSASEQQAAQAAFWRSVSSALLDRRPELSIALAEQALTGRALVDLLVAGGLISADDLYEAVIPIAVQPRTPQPADEAPPSDTRDATPIRLEHPAYEDGVVYMLPRTGTYALVERQGPVPTLGELVELDGNQFLVTRVGRSPLPFDSRACVFLTHT